MSSPPRQLTPELDNYKKTIFDIAINTSPRSHNKGVGKRPPQDQLSSEKEGPSKIFYLPNTHGQIQLREDLCQLQAINPK
jgi:hypothetical protein